MKRIRFKYLVLSFLTLMFILFNSFPVQASNNILWRISFYSPNNGRVLELCVTFISITLHPEAPNHPYGWNHIANLYGLSGLFGSPAIDPSTLNFIGICQMPPPPPGINPDDWDNLDNWDFDGDGVPNGTDPTPYGTDANGDGVPDPFQDLNGDGLPDGGLPTYQGPRNCPSDGDCDGLPDSSDPDDDNDGIPDSSDPTPGGDDGDGPGDDDCEPDANGDGVPDDTDGDGIPDCEEEECNPDANGDGVPDDEDGDGTPDCEEEECNPDANGDGVPDDEDGDGTPDCEEDERDDCPFDGESSGFLDAFASFLPSSPESIRIPVIISRIAGGNTLAGNFLLVMWEGAYQLFLIISLIKFYKLLPFT
jgi:hypothetical protein